MPANPERMRPTDLSHALIVQEANIVVLQEAVKISKDSQKIFKGGTLFTAAQRFIKNTLLDKKE